MAYLETVEQRKPLTGSEKEKKEFVCMAIHDLRSPIQGLKGWCEWGINKAPSSEEIKEVLTIAYPYSQTAAKIISEIPVDLLICESSPQTSKGLITWLLVLRKEAHESVSNNKEWNKEEERQELESLITDSPDYFHAVTSEIRRHIKRAEEIIREGLDTEMFEEKPIPWILGDIKRLEPLIDDSRDLFYFDQLHPLIMYTKIVDIVDEIKRDFEERGANQGHEIIVEDNLETSLHTDTEFVGKIVLNLVENAIRYSYPDSSPIKVKIGQNETDTFISVQDQGIGMGIKDIDFVRSFYPGRRTESAKDHSEQGTGYGLYLCQKLADKLGGEITVESPGKNQGSTFSLFLPFL